MAVTSYERWCSVISLTGDRDTRNTDDGPQGMIRIREASIYALKGLPEAERHCYGVRVLTMRRWPRGVRRTAIDIWVPTAGPSTDLLTALRAGALAWEQFITRYMEEQEQQRSCRVVSYEQGIPHPAEYACRSLDYLAHLAHERGTITVLCWEQDEHCHRFHLVHALEDLERRMHN